MTSLSYFTLQEIQIQKKKKRSQLNNKAIFKISVNACLALKIQASIFFIHHSDLYICREVYFACRNRYFSATKERLSRPQERKKRRKMPKSRVNISVISSIPATDYDVRVLLLSANIITTTMAERLWKMVSTLLFVLFFKSWNLFAYNFSHYSFTVTNCSCKCG